VRINLKPTQSSVDRIEALSLTISDLIGQLEPRPKLTEAITAMICLCTYKIESEMPNMIEVLEPLRELSKILVAAHMIEDIKESN